MPSPLDLLGFRFLTILDDPHQSLSFSSHKNFTYRQLKVKVEQPHYRPGGFQEVEAPRIRDSRHMKVVRLPALRTGRVYLAGNIPGTHFF
jgi:hypothetical protein